MIPEDCPELHSEAPQLDTDIGDPSGHSMFLVVTVAISRGNADFSLHFCLSILPILLENLYRISLLPDISLGQIEIGDIIQDLSLLRGDCQV